MSFRTGKGPWLPTFRLSGYQTRQLVKVSLKFRCPLYIPTFWEGQQELTGLVDYSRRPFDGELAAITLWPEVEKIFGHGYEVCLFGPIAICH